MPAASDNQPDHPDTKSAAQPCNQPGNQPASGVRPSIAARIEPVLAELRTRGWDEAFHPLHVFDEGVTTAAAAAASIGCEVGAIANSLIFVAQPAGTPVLILTSGAHRVDTALTARTIGVEALGRADADFVRTHTGQAIGGVAPLGHPQPIPTYLDTALAAYPEIWAAAGHSHTVFRTTYVELSQLTGASEIAVEQP